MAGFLFFFVNSLVFLFQADTGLMVVPDLTVPETSVCRGGLAKRPAIASVADRFLALVLDFLIFSPVISLLVAGLIRQTKTFFLLNPVSLEGGIAVGLIVVMVVFFTMLLQTVFLYYWQATAGQAFLRLKVVSYPEARGRLSLNQCFTRSFMWCAGFVLMGIPYLEVLSHPLRRAFHERSSDTLVVTLKKNFDEGPLPLESRFISSWLRMSFLFMLFFGTMTFIKTYHSLVRGDYREHSIEQSSFCKEIDEPGLVGIERLDAALSLFLLNSISPECLDKEADASLWGDPVNAQGMAYLAKYLLGDSSTMQEKYFSKVCHNSKSSVCAIARYLRDGGKNTDLQYADNELLTTRLLWSEEKYSRKDYDGSLKIIKELQTKPVLKVALEKRYVRSIWSLHENEKSGKKKKERLPASVGQGWIDTFKDRYEVP